MADDDIKCEVLTDEAIKYDLTFKMIIIGDSGVGKSSLTLKATRNKFDDFYNATVGFEFYTFNVKIDDKIIKLQIWDTCGQEIYRSLISSFYKNSAIAMIVYSIDREESFTHLEYWINQIKNNSNPNTRIILIGNKADLEEKRQVSKEEGEKLALEHGICENYETSAKTGFNSQLIFVQSCKLLYKDYLKYKELANEPKMVRVGSTDSLPHPNNNKKKGCC